jgi:predicted negative regulator of RcsB-dependent stress response
MESEAAQIPLWQQAYAWFEANKRTAVLGAGVVLLASLIIAFVLYRRNEAEITASEALSNVTLPGVAGTNRADTAEAYLRVAAAYPNSTAGARALLFAASGLYMDGKYNEAKALFERFTKEHTDSQYMGDALLGIASCLDAQGKAPEAITAYKELIDRHPSFAVVPQARFALGRLYEGQNKPELARNMFEEVERSRAYSSLGSEAGMRLEELKLKYTNLVISTVPPSSNAVPVTAPKR